MSSEWRRLPAPSAPSDVPGVIGRHVQQTISQRFLALHNIATFQARHRQYDGAQFAIRWRDPGGFAFGDEQLAHRRRAALYRPAAPDTIGPGASAGACDDPEMGSQLRGGGTRYLAALPIWRTCYRKGDRARAYEARRVCRASGARAAPRGILLTRS